MAHADYNRTIEVFSGPGAFPPNVLKTTIVGRGIFNPNFVWQNGPMNLSVGYVTTDYGGIVAAPVSNVGQTYTRNYSLADRLRILGPGGSSVVVLEKVLCRYNLAKPYWRYYCVTVGIAPF